MKFKEYKFSPGISLNANLYLSPLDHFLPEQYSKFKIKSTFFEFIIEPFNNNAQILVNLRENQRSFLNEIRNHLEVLTLFLKASAPLIVEIKTKSEDSPPLSFGISIRAGINSWFEIYNIAEMATVICRHFHILESNILVSINELIQSEDSIKSFYQVIHTDPKTVSVDFSITAQEYQQGTRAVCTSSMMAIIGNYTVGCFYGILDSLTLINENQCRLSADELLFGNDLLAIETEIIAQETIDRKFDEFESELQSKGLLTIRMT